MAPDGLGTELVAITAAVAAAVALGLTWNLARAWRCVLLRTATIVFCLVTITAAGGVWVNRQVDFLPTWSGGADAMNTTTTTSTTYTGSTTNSTTATTTAGPGGRILTFTVAGPASKLTMPMYAYLPPGYDSRSPVRYPVIEALHGYPGTPLQWMHAMTVAQILDGEIAAGRMAPTIVLFPYQTPAPLLDTECTNLFHGPQTETFLTRDVPAFARAHLKVRTDQSAWGLIGYSAGGYCASDLLLRHPTQYAAAASMSGYSNPGIRVGDGSEHTTYNDVWRLRTQPVPAVALYLTCAKSDRGAMRSTQALAKAVHGPISLTTVYINGGGHSAQTWRAMEAPAFDWLSTWLGRPTGSAPAKPAPPAQPAAKAASAAKAAARAKPTHRAKPAHRATPARPPATIGEP